MGLLLLACSLLSSHVLPGMVVDAQRKFTIRSVDLQLEPGSNVTRGTDVTVRCVAAVSRLGHEPLGREYTVFKDNEKVYTKTSVTPEDLLYGLPAARVSNTGRYMCAVSIEGKEVKSEAKRLTVTGLAKPVLRLNSSEVTEGERVAATCEAPGETGSMFFYFHEGSSVIAESKGSSNRLEAELRFSSAGRHTLRCAYTVLVLPESFRSEQSDAADVTVRALTITPVLEVSPQSGVFEGDHLYVLCSVRNQHAASRNVNLYLSRGTRLLAAGGAQLHYNVTALANQSEDWECRLETGSVEKVARKRLLVTELFSAPRLTVAPAEVFQRDHVTLTCRSERLASERLAAGELVYSLRPTPSLFRQTSAGVFSGRSLSHDLNYTCEARARGVAKASEALTVRPKVPASAPEISALGLAVVGRTLGILCRSAAGSLPINYTLLRNDSQVTSVVVRLPSQGATFQVAVTGAEEVSQYSCEARNRREEAPRGPRLNATVIVPLTKPTLLVHPGLAQTYEGDELLLICGVTGSPPVTYKWYRDGIRLKTNSSTRSSMGYHVQRLSRADGGDYHCEAFNTASGVHSDTVTIEVFMAVWKRALIGGVSVLVAAGLLVACVLYFKAQRGPREAAAELSVRSLALRRGESDRRR